MAGTTITRVGKDPNKLLYEIVHLITEKRAIMQPDSAIMLYNPTTNEEKAYKLEYANEEKFRSGEPAVVETKELGRGAVVAAQFSKKFGTMPKKGEWVGMVHLHT